MIIKYCPMCNGKPYTEDFFLLKCPVCNSDLQSEMVEEKDLINRIKITPHNTFFDIPNANNQGFGEGPNETENTPAPFKSAAPTVLEITKEISNLNGSANEKDFSKVVKGKVSQYSSTGKEDGEYRRLLPVKVYQAFVYRQRLEDVLHRFTVRVEQGEDALGYQQYTDIPVNVHGTIAGGLQIVDNAEVEVYGKYRNGVLMADSVYIINNGYKSKVGFQHSVKAITYGILSAIMLAFVCFVALSSGGSFLANIKEFCTVWLVFAAIITVLYLVTSLTKIGLLTRMLSNKKRSFPLVGILLISLALAFLFVNAFGSFTGFGSYLSGWIYSIVPIIIILVALFLIIKSVF